MDESCCSAVSVKEEVNDTSATATATATGIN